MLIMRSLNIEVLGCSVHERGYIDPNGHDPTRVRSDMHCQNEFNILAVHLVHTRRFHSLPKVLKCGKRDVDRETPHSLV